MAKWKPLKNADGRGGVRFREHKNRKHGAIPDRYFVIYYKRKGKLFEEAVGWAGDGWTPTKCFELLAEIKRNYKMGKSPSTLKEMRELADEEKKEKQAQEEKRRGRTLKDFFYNTYYPSARVRWTKETAEKPEIHVRLWIDPVTGGTPFDELDITHVQQILRNLAEAGRSNRTQQYVFRTFSMIWNAAVDHGLTDKRCPTKVASFRLPKIDNERQRYLTLEEERIILQKIHARSPQAHNMAVISLYTGMRWREVARLRWWCLDVASRRISVLNTKGKKDRVLPMPNRVVDLINSMPSQDPDKLVFPDPDGELQPLVVNPVREAFKESGLNDNVTDKKMRASFHSLRHTYASRLVQGGVDLYRVQKLMGHSTLAMTARYSKLADENLHQAVKVLDRNPPKHEPKVYPRSGNGKVIPFKKSG